MENPVSWILTAWFSSATILMFGGGCLPAEAAGRNGGFSAGFLCRFLHITEHILTVMCTHLVRSLHFFKCGGRQNDVSGSIRQYALGYPAFFAMVLAAEPGVVRLIETRLPWMNGRKNAQNDYGAGFL